MKKLIMNKQVVLGALVMMIVVAGAVNWAVRRANDQTVPASTNPTEYEQAVPVDAQPIVTDVSGNDYFATARLDRDTSRGKELDIHKEIINNDKSTIDAKKSAEQEIKRIAISIENEAVIENLIKAKGFAQSVAFINSDSVDIIVSANGLLPAQVAQIKDIVIEKTGITADKIKIIETK